MFATLAWTARRLQEALAIELARVSPSLSLAQRALAV